MPPSSVAGSGTAGADPLAPGADLPDWAAAAVTQALDAGEDINSVLPIAAAVGTRLPLPGDGATAVRWQVLAALARATLTTARVTEAHTDALAIIAENATDNGGGAGGPQEPLRRTWGVFAAEAPDARLDAETTPDGTQLRGRKPWCSLGGRLDAALVTAREPATGDRRLYAVDLHHPTVTAATAQGWVARGLRTVPSGPVDFAGTPAVPVGDPGWYLRRPGFAWGGLGVAACWHGGALGLADTLRARARPGDLADLALGRVDVALHTSGTVLGAAATAVDTGKADGAAGARLALRVRSVVAGTVDEVLAVVARTLGPAPLAFDAAHAARVADLELYVRQHHGERDLAALGASLRADGASA